MFKKMLPIILAVIVSGGVFFYVGMKVGQGSSSQTATNNFRNFQANATGTLGGFKRSGGQGGLVTGQIIAKDANSITVKLNNGGSNIVLYSDATKVSKSVSGTSADLTNGEQVVVSGASNSDGSITASTIQLRPDMSTSTGQ